MEKINLVQFLKDCPKGMKLDCTMYNSVTLINVDNSGNTIFPIKVKLKNGDIINLTKYGQYTDADFAKCVIFPKGKTTWEGFHRPFEPGDIVINDNNEHAFIYSGENDSCWEAYCGVYCGTRNICVNSKQWSDKKHKLRLATEEEKEKLFQVIKDNGYEWNAESKTLKKSIKVNFKDGDIVYIKTNVFEHIFIFKVSKDDKFIEGYASLSGTGLYLDGYPVCETNDVKEIRLATQQEKEKLFDILKPTGYHWNSETKTLEYMIKPKFKVGDKIRSKNKKDECFYILNVDEDNYKYVLNIKGYCLEFKDQDNYELVSDISIEPKFKIGDKVRYKNNHNIAFTITNIEEDTYVCGTKAAFWFEDQDKFELVPNKFDINTLKPFDKVLVRDHDKAYWDITFYECYDKTNKSYPYRTLGGTVYKQCIPYKGNEDLAGIVKECSDYYKTWINEENEFN